MSDEPAPEADCVDGAPHPRHAPLVLGQEAAEASFFAAADGGRLHHAWLLTGPPGVGKATLAWHLAKYLLARPSAPVMPGLANTPGPALESAVLRRVAALSEPGLFLLRRGFDDRRKVVRTVITVDEIRALKGFFSLSRPDGGWRVVIVDSADDMNTSAANALLKVLEEPPPRTIFFLISAQPGRLLPTIRSRCRTLACMPVAEDALAQILLWMSLDTPLTAEEIAALLPLAGGSAGRAVRLHMQDGAALDSALSDLFAGLPGLDRVAAQSLCAALAARDQEQRRSLFLTLLAERLAALARAGIPDRQGGKPAPPELRSLAPDIASARQWAAAEGELIARARRGLALNIDPQAMLFDLLLQVDAVAGRCAAR